MFVVKSKCGACTAIGTVLAAALLLTACGSSTTPAAAAPAIKVLSNRADLVSAGDALVEIDPPAGADAAKLGVSLNGANISAMFATRPNGKFQGLVTGLIDGPNTLTASAPGGHTASITITNHPNGGPLLYGPQVQPWGCDAGATDAQCNRPVAYSYKYISTNQNLTGFQPYDPAHPASDVAQTTTDQGTSVPFIVRIETGTQDRDYYNVAVLYDPQKPWAPWAPQSGWNQKVLFMHGAGCGMGYNESNKITGANILDQYALSRGYVVASSALNDAGHNCNIAVEAESMVMLKEHLIETYGPIRYAFGWGTSGGALAQQWLANAYPGLYDGIIVGLAFPDAGSTATEVEDCALLRHYFTGAGASWTTAQQAAVAGHVNSSGDAVCRNWIDMYGFNKALNPSEGLSLTDPIIAALGGVSLTASGGCDAPVLQIYNPVLDPGGIRCDFWDYAVTLFGQRPSDGFGKRAYSNVGVQYGLQALSAGTISPQQFVDLNAAIGSHDIDYNFQQSRVAMDPGASATAYKIGWINEANGMNTVAILHFRELDVTTIHHEYRSWVMRARLDRAFGTHANQAIWFNAGTQDEAYDVMDQWLAAVKADSGSGDLAQKIIRNRPAQANDRCGTQDGTGLSEFQCIGVVDQSPRMAAGEDIHDDIVECQLKPMDRSSYTVSFTDAQWAQLQSVFPGGVCDYSQPDAGQQATQPWQTYMDANGMPVVGGTPLPSPPPGSPGT